MTEDQCNEAKTLPDSDEGKDRQALESNRGLNVGDIVTEVRSHPYIKGGKSLDFWDFKHETLYFEVVEVFQHEYRVRYIDGEDVNPFYWPFWDKQPNHGFMPNGSSCVRYYAPQSGDEEKGD